MTAGLHKDDDGEMWAWCPACGEEVIIEKDDISGEMPDGTLEYFTYCSECGQGFYSSEAYNN